MFRYFIGCFILTILVLISVGSVVFLVTSDTVQGLTEWNIPEDKYKENVYWWLED